MKKLYGYSGELAKRIERVEAAGSSNVVNEMLWEQWGIDDNMTFGEMLLRYCSHMLDLPEDIWGKCIDEIKPEDMKAFFELWENDVTTFVKEN